jgi:S-adenosyl methyltransferase
VLRARPAILLNVRANRRFLTRTVRYLAAEAGLVQLSGWRPTAADVPAPSSGYGAVARKP